LAFSTSTYLVQNGFSTDLEQYYLVHELISTLLSTY
jgi:hypothetical protein